MIWCQKLSQKLLLIWIFIIKSNEEWIFRQLFGSHSMLILLVGPLLDLITFNSNMKIYKSLRLKMSCLKSQISDKFRWKLTTVQNIMLKKVDILDYHSFAPVHTFSPTDLPWPKSSWKAQLKVWKKFFSRNVYFCHDVGYELLNGGIHVYFVFYCLIFLNMIKILF